MADQIKITVETHYVEDLGPAREKQVKMQEIIIEEDFTNQGSGEITLTAGQADYEFSPEAGLLILRSKVESDGTTYKSFEVNVGATVNDAITTKLFAYQEVATPIFLTNPDGVDPITIEYTYKS